MCRNRDAGTLISVVSHGRAVAPQAPGPPPPRIRHRHRPEDGVQESGGEQRVSLHTVGTDRQVAVPEPHGAVDLTRGEKRLEGLGLGVVPRSYVYADEVVPAVCQEVHLGGPPAVAEHPVSESGDHAGEHVLGARGLDHRRRRVQDLAHGRPRVHGVENPCVSDVKLEKIPGAVGGRVVGDVAADAEAGVGEPSDGGAVLPRPVGRLPAVVRLYLGEEEPPAAGGQLLGDGLEGLVDSLPDARVGIYAGDAPEDGDYLTVHAVHVVDAVRRDVFVDGLGHPAHGDVLAHLLAGVLHLDLVQGPAGADPPDGVGDYGLGDPAAPEELLEVEGPHLHVADAVGYAAADHAGEGGGGDDVAVAEADQLLQGGPHAGAGDDLVQEDECPVLHDGVPAVLVPDPGYQRQGVWGVGEHGAVVGVALEVELHEVLVELPELADGRGLADAPGAGYDERSVAVGAAPAVELRVDLPSQHNDEC